MIIHFKDCHGMIELMFMRAPMCLAGSIGECA
jgi:hypothetical protein